jgi:hypothetical protein
MYEKEHCHYKLFISIKVLVAVLPVETILDVVTSQGTLMVQNL